MQSTSEASLAGAVVLDVAADLARPLRRVQARNEVKRHVDPGRDSRRGDDLAGIDKAIVGADIHPLAECREQIERVPMRRRRQAIEKAGDGVGERAGADAGHQSPRLAQATHPSADLLIAELRTSAATAGIDEDVDHVELGG